MAASVPPPIDLGSMLVRWSLSPFAVLGCAAALTWYLIALRRVRARGADVPRRRSLAFAAGIGVVLVALASSIDTYADVSFTVHMVQHLLLTFVAPPLLALGAPVALAIRASDPDRGRDIAGALDGRVARVGANPVVGFGIFAALPFVLHLTSVYDLALRDPWVHAAEHLVLVGAGALYWWPLVGADPMPHRPGYGARVLSLLLLLPAQAFLALALFSAGAPLYETYRRLPPPFGGEAALGDQRTAAAIMWVFGAIFVIACSIALAARWRTDEEARQARLEARSDATG